MAARDDSVIRGSLITTLILLVLSLALNFLLWSMGNRAALSEARKTEALNDKDTAIRSADDKIRIYEGMLGKGTISKDVRDAMEDANTGDANFDDIQKQFYSHMKLFGPEEQDPNYYKMPDYFMSTIRERNERYTVARRDVDQIRVAATSDIDTARMAQQTAENERENSEKKLDEAETSFANYRNDMLQKMEQAKDSKTKSEREMQALRKKSLSDVGALKQKTKNLSNTIETQKLELNKLRGGRFESVQGEIRYVLRGADIVSINLGSADALRRGITFGVIDKDETDRLQDASVKASIQVIKIRGPHLAECRVVATPEIGSPIIVGDAVYSPFWSPGRTVRIALGGNIDIDGDDRPDNEILEGLVISAGAEVAQKLDPAVRFLVIGESPDLGGEDEDRDAQEIAAVGALKEQAREMGVTVIPAWKLQAYLATLDDSITTPLGSAVRGEDFPATSPGGPSRRRPVDLPDMFKLQRDNVQTTNEIVRP